MPIYSKHAKGIPFIDTEYGHFGPAKICAGADKVKAAGYEIVQTSGKNLNLENTYNWKFEDFKIQGGTEQKADYHEASGLSEQKDDGYYEVEAEYTQNTAFTHEIDPDYPHGVYPSIPADDYSFEIDEKEYDVSVPFDLGSVDDAKDSIIFDKYSELGWIEKDTWSYIFDGFEDGWDIYSYDATYTTYKIKLNSISATRVITKCYCKYFEFDVDLLSKNKEGFLYAENLSDGYGVLYLKILNSRFSGVDGLRNWLASLEDKLKIIIPLSETQLYNGNQEVLVSGEQVWLQDTIEDEELSTLKIEGGTTQVADYRACEGESTQDGVPNPGAPVDIEPYVAAGTYRFPGTTLEVTIPALHGKDDVRDMVVWDRLSGIAWVYKPLKYDTLTAGNGWTITDAAQDSPYMCTHLPQGTLDGQTLNGTIGESFGILYQLATPTRTPLTVTDNPESTAPELPMEAISPVLSPDYPQYWYDKGLNNIVIQGKNQLDCNGLEAMGGALITVGCIAAIAAVITCMGVAIINDTDRVTAVNIVWDNMSSALKDYFLTQTALYTVGVTSIINITRPVWDDLCALIASIFTYDPQTNTGSIGDVAAPKAIQITTEIADNLTIDNFYNYTQVAAEGFTLPFDYKLNSETTLRILGTGSYPYFRFIHNNGDYVGYTQSMIATYKILFLPMWDNCPTGNRLFLGWDTKTSQSSTTHYYGFLRGELHPQVFYNSENGITYSLRIKSNGDVIAYKQGYPDILLGQSVDSWPEFYYLWVVGSVDQPILSDSVSYEIDTDYFPVAGESAIDIPVQGSVDIYIPADLDDLTDMAASDLIACVKPPTIPIPRLAEGEVYDVGTGACDGLWGEKVFDGTETGWAKSGTYTDQTRFYFSVPDALDNNATNNCRCSHVQSYAFDSLPSGNFVSVNSSPRIYLRLDDALLGILPTDDDATRVVKLNAWFAAEYAANRPVKVRYLRATPLSNPQEPITALCTQNQTRISQDGSSNIRCKITAGIKHPKLNFTESVGD